jgi:ribosomal-protein-alanine N-acetyltransferase
MSSIPQAINQEFVFSRMTEHDLLDVVELEEKSGLSRWGWGAYYSELQSANRNLMLVARARQSVTGSHEAILGYIVARHVAGELHINNVAVRETFRRRGIGSQLLNSVVEEARREGAKIAFLEVRSGNKGAQALYEKCGFRGIARRRNYYTAPLEDAIVMSMTF